MKHISKVEISRFPNFSVWNRLDDATEKRNSDMLTHDLGSVKECQRSHFVHRLYHCKCRLISLTVHWMRCKI